MFKQKQGFSVVSNEWGGESTLSFFVHIFFLCFYWILQHNTWIWWKPRASDVGENKKQWVPVLKDNDAVHFK